MQQPRLLCVDDSTELLAGYSEYFSRHGFYVRTTADPNEAIRIATEDRIDLAIVDYHMPAIDGGQLSVELRRVADFPIIMVTADVLGLPTRVRETVASVVSKGDGMRQVLEIVRSFLID